eukprot:SAG31_NODE_18257_length_642_cov_0.839779_1_plen_26_part_10
MSALEPTSVQYVPLTNVPLAKVPALW